MSRILAEADGLIIGNRLRNSLHWGRSQLNPVHSGDIVVITLSPGSASALGNNNDITLVPGFNYTFYLSVWADQRGPLGVKEDNTRCYKK